MTHLNLTVHRVNHGENSGSRVPALKAGEQSLTVLNQVNKPQTSSPASPLQTAGGQLSNNPTATLAHTYPHTVHRCGEEMAQDQQTSGHTGAPAGTEPAEEQLTPPSQQLRDGSHLVWIQQVEPQQQLDTSAEENVSHLGAAARSSRPNYILRGCERM